MSFETVSEESSLLRNPPLSSNSLSDLNQRRSASNALNRSGSPHQESRHLQISIYLKNCMTGDYWAGSR